MKLLRRGKSIQAHQLQLISKWFETFTENFHGESIVEQRNYDLKTYHTLQVRSIIESLASSLDLSCEDCALASAIAICHDVGRFPQYQQYGTFNDTTSTNHAALSVKTLREEGILAHVDSDRCRLLLQSVALHNVLILPENLDNTLKRNLHLIRDADKLDIWRVLIEYCSSNPVDRASAVIWELPDTGICSDIALGEVLAGRVLKRSLLNTVDDFKLLQLSWVYDLIFDESFQVLAERGYIDSIANLLPSTNECQKAIQVVKTYVKSRVDCRR